MRGLIVLGFLGFSLCARAQVPGAVAGVRPCPGVRDCWLWDAAPEATSYTVHRGTGYTLPLLATSGPDSCVAARQSLPLAVPAHPAPPSGLWWYQVTATGAGGEGPPDAGQLLNSTGPCCNELIYAESFSQPDGSPWPDYWSVFGNVGAADVTGGMGRWRPSMSFAPWPYALARQGVRVLERDGEAEFTIRFSSIATQGMGFYLRSNAGYLAPGNPPNVGPLGRGYAVFIEGFRGAAAQRVGLWRETNGVEQEITFVPPPFALQNGVRYRVRFRVTQISAGATRLQAKLWLEGSAEPPAWQVSADDATPVLQNLYGGYGVDSYAHLAPSQFIELDDIRIIRLCGP